MPPLAARARLSRTRTAVAAIGMAGVVALAALPSSAAPAASEPFPTGPDPLSHVLPEHMTWDDYRPVPGYDWNDPSHQPPRKVRAALILGDFREHPFIVEKQGLTDDPADFYKRFLITEPSELNNHHTINEYWLEDSFGLVGVDADAFGPYTLPGKVHEYGITSDMNNPAQDCPAGDSCGKDIDTALIQASAADVTTGMVTNGGRDYDFRWLMHAGWDESGTWEEFGPMMFTGPDSVTNDIDPRTGEPLGNPNPKTEGKHSAKTRYARPDGPWTAFFSAKYPWAHALPGAYSLQGESDGASVFAHELSHIFGVLDNYGNPFAANADRDYSGPWDMLSRGTFNGPGGPHNRWHIPATQGATMGAHHMLRTKVRLGFVSPTDVVYTTKDALKLGPVITDVLQREQPMTAMNRVNGLKYGVNVVLGQDNGDTKCARPGRVHCSGTESYDNYTVEVVNRVGYDSFTPDSGVLIAKTKNADLSPFLWVVDAHPDDIGAVDYIKPDGTPQPYRFGDYRQLSDALFKAGTKGTHPDLGSKGLARNDETTNTFVDAGNQLKFLVLKRIDDASGVLRYRVAVLSTVPALPDRFGVAVAGGSTAEGAPGAVVRRQVTVRNTGSTTDIIRVQASSASADVQVPNDLVEVAAGQTASVEVLVRSAEGGCADLQVVATSEGNTAKTASTTLSCSG